MKNRRHKKSGFTIVELLIVIVVIAILAGISIVAYNGIQKRATLVKERQDLNTLAKSMQSYVASGGSFNDKQAGSDGDWFGGGDGKTSNSASYASLSMREKLQEEGFLPQSYTRNFFISFCTARNAPERVVMIQSSIAPDDSPSDQIAPTVCTAGGFSGYVNTYGMNMVKVVR